MQHHSLYYLFSSFILIVLSCYDWNFSHCEGLSIFKEMIAFVSYYPSNIALILLQIHIIAILENILAQLLQVCSYGIIEVIIAQIMKAIQRYFTHISHGSLLCEVLFALKMQIAICMIKIFVFDHFCSRQTVLVI